MTSPINISEIQPDEISNLLKGLWLRLAEEMFEIEHYIMPVEANGDRWVRFVRENLIDEKGFLLVAINEDRPVGFAYFSLIRDFPFQVSEHVGVINDVYVLPEFRGKGVGKRLLIECIKKMEAHSVTAIRPSVLRDDKVAVKLYKRLGFRTCRYGMLKSVRH